LILKTHNNNFENAIVLTGGIATGKSTVAEYLIKNSFNIIDADKISHIILDNNYNKIKDLFGDEYINGLKVNRKKLGSLIFNNLEAKLALEELLHPLIKNEIILQSKEYELENKIYFIDIPLFFEKSNYKIKRTLLVYTTESMQLDRLMKRDMCDKDTALSRINNQISIEEKRKLSTYIIDNTKDLVSLQNEIDLFLKEIL
jgi:dephospho-CoA kinase